MQIRLLGHVEASVDGRPVTLGGSKQRAVLAMLGLEANRLVSAERLIEGLWGEDAPASAGKMVQNYVWRLRKVLADGGDAEIVTRGHGYELRIDRERIDALRLERLVGEASRESGGDLARQALALFRGEPLADLAGEPFAGAEIRRLEELRWNAAQLAIDADLAAGRHQDVIGEIEALLIEHPLRERLHAQRLLALYRCGRQADALEAFREARGTLVEQIGVEPGPELRQLHAAILRQDPALTVEAPLPELPQELERAAAAAMLGRERELRALHRLWRRAGAGEGALITLVGAYGMGKTRVAAQLARDVHGDGATVLHASGAGPSESALTAIARAAEARRSTLLILDDADRAPPDVQHALRALGVGRRPLMTIATGLQAAALERLDPSASLVLEPLDAQAVGAIAALYVPEGSELPAGELLAASRGVPRRVHEAASEWARRYASDRVERLAGRAAAGRSEARALESELAGSVADLQVTMERIEARPAADRVVCPYKGLASFDADDAEYFFGREALVAELVAHLVGAPLLAVVGPSGSGKSSALRAGLLPALSGGVLPGSQHWRQTMIRPGEHPARELRRLAPDERGVLAVDQFEELFTACTDERERAEFIAALLRFPRVVVAVRADFYGHCAAYPELSRALGGNHVLVGPMTREELRRAIERPAERAGLVVEPELTDALLTDVEGEPGALPLLSTALLELWGRRDGRRLHLAAYVRTGRVQGAVARLAEDAFVALAPAQQAAARTLFLRLCDEDESGAIVRRRLSLGEQDDAVVSELIARRLLTASEGTVEVAHEALLREWPRLRGWLDEDIEGRRLHRRVREATQAWEADGREPGGLYRGARLVAALDWAAEHDDELEPAERAFLEAGRRASGAAQRRLRAGLAGVASLLVLALIAGIVALHQRNQAIARQTDADAQRLAARALASDDLEFSLLLGRQAVALRDTAQTRGDLLAALLKSPAAIGVIHGVGQPTTLTLGSGGRTLVERTPEGVLRFIDAATGRAAGPSRAFGDMPDDGPVFDSSGARVAPDAQDAEIRDARTWTPLVTLQGTSYLFKEAFSVDGRELFILEEGPSKTTALRRYDARSGTPIGASRTIAFNDKQPLALFVLQDGRRIATSISGRVAIRDARTLKPLWSLEDPSIAQVAVSPDDRTLLLGGEDGAIAFVDASSGAVHRVPGRQRAAVVQVAFSPDGRTAVSAGRDDVISVWDVAHRTVRETLTGHSAIITGLVFSRDGRTLYSSGLDGEIMVWDMAGDRRLASPFALSRAPTGYALSPDDRTLAVGDGDGTLTLVDAATQRRRTLRVSDGALAGVAFTDDRHVLATVPRDRRSPSGYGVVIDTRTGSLGPRLAGLGSPSAPRVDARGSRMALVWHGAAMVQPLVAGRPAGRPRFYRRSGGTVSVDISSDGRTLAVGTQTGIEIVDATSMRVRGFLLGSETAQAPPRFLDGGRLVAVGSREGWVRLWSAATSRPVSLRLPAHIGPVVGLAISPDGRTLASGGTDGVVRLFDLIAQQPLDARLPVAPNTPVDPVFSRDGTHLFAITASGHGYRWDLRPASWILRACAVAGRTLTPTEWRQALPGRPYHTAC